MTLNHRRFQRIKRGIIEKPYVFSFIGIFLIYIAVNLIVNQLYVNLNIFTSFALWFRIPFLLFNFLLIPALAALTINLSIIKFREMKLVKGKGESKFTFAGMFGGILGGACPSCFLGLFPAFLGLFGITASLSILPFYGLEIQAASVGLLVVAVILLTRDSVCKLPKTNFNF